ncbi:hypothetical protein LMG8520_2277 [Lactococcus lactis subsp. lactis]|uniref:Uncharacterized protein n=2 Tax=Lactococcus lactis TaxID=1358 RepID=A0A2A5SIY6_LACLH|nr:hypothetical protein [Lactococcus lactis]KSU05968.1 hypothetical protein LMG8520_2277 [Lactococcus lactis subsp. lactis]PCS13410.1 hypothetical protein RU90_GL002374 [Lactococcus lactis subsp. hordniae]
MTTIDITEQALGKQLVALRRQEIIRKNDEIKRLRKAGRTKNGKFKTLVYQQTVILSTSKKRMIINKSALPIKLTVPKGYTEQKLLSNQAERDLKTHYDKDIIEPLFNESLEQSMAKKSNGKNIYWIGMELYWAGYARGVREHRQKVRKTAQSAFDIIGADDVAQLSHELGVSEDKLTYAVLEVISKRKNGGKA